MLDKILRWGITGLIFLMPLFFLPYTSEFYDFNKNLLLIFGVSLLLVLWTAKMLAEKRFVLRRTIFDFPVLLIALSSLASLFMASTNKVEALTMPGGAATILALTVFYFLMTNHAAILGELPVRGLLSSAALLGLVALYQFFGVGEAFIPAGQGLDWLRLKSFSPAGGLFSAALFLSVILIIAAYQFYRKFTAWKNRPAESPALETSQTNTNPESASLFLTALAVLLIAAGLGVSVFQLLTVSSPIFLPQITGWVVALEAFKNLPFFGVGVENFLSAFTAGKPLNFNLNQFWGARFAVSSNFYFQLLTTMGIIGLSSFIYLVLKVVKIISGKDQESYALLAVFILLALFPAPLLLLITLYILLALLAGKFVLFEVSRESAKLVQASLAVALTVTLAGFFIFGRVWLADLYFRNSLVAASLNRGGETYNLQIKAIQTNPYSDLYHLALSQTNLALANSIAGKKDLTDADRTSINQLVTQSINEGKLAINNDAARVTNWENLAAIYRSLINVASGADSWSLAAYNQAITLDPLNPALRLNLGGVYFGIKNYDEAIRQFSMAVNLKSDFANAHYNLAVALAEKGDLKNALAELKQTQTLVEYDSNDYKKLSSEIENLKAKLPPEQTIPASGQPETLTPPATPTTQVKPPIQLPAQAAPPAVATPSPQPSFSSSPEATASPSTQP